MATGRGSTTVRAGTVAGATSDAPRRPSLALQPFAWGGLQILPVAPSAAESVAVIPPALPGMHRTAPFRVSEYDKRSRAAVAALEAALGLGELGRAKADVQQPSRVGMNLELDPDLDEDLRAALDLSDLSVPLPPGISRGFGAPNSKSQEYRQQQGTQGPRPSRSLDGPIFAASMPAETALATGIDGLAVLDPTWTRADALLLQQEMQSPRPGLTAGDDAAAGTENVVRQAVGAEQGSSSWANSRGNDAMVASGKEFQQVDLQQVDQQQVDLQQVDQQQVDLQQVDQQQVDQQQVDVGVPGQDRNQPNRQEIELQGVPLQGSGPSYTDGLSKLQLGLTRQQQHRDGGLNVSHDLPLAPEHPAVAVLTVPAQQPVGSPVGLAEGEQHVQRCPQPQQQHQQQEKGKLAENHQAEPTSGIGRPAKRRRRVAPAQYQENIRLSPLPRRGQQATAISAAPEQQEQRQRQQQQQQQEQEKEEQHALDWWERFSTAAAQLESLKSILQSASGAPLPRGDGRGRQQQLQSQMHDTSADPERQGAGEVREEDEELYKEVEREEKARQQRIVGEADDNNQRDRRRGRRRAAAADQAIAVAGVYGIAAEAEGGDGTVGRLRLLPAAAVASWNRILVALNELPQPSQTGLGPPDDGRDQTSVGREQLQEGEQGEDLSLQDELVIWVAVCGPGQPQVLHEEFLVLGSQYLSELRDVLGCATEDAMKQVAQVAQPARTAGGGSGCGGFGGRHGHGDSDGADDNSERDHARKTGTKGTATTTGTRGARGGRGRQGPPKGRNHGSSGSELQPASPPSAPDAATLLVGTEAMEICGSAGMPPSVADQAPLAGVVGRSGNGAPAGRCGGGTTAGSSTGQIAGSPAALVGPPSPSGSLLPPSYGSYLFVEGHFYSDVRHPEAEDYTAPIRELCSAHGVRPVCLRPERGWRPTLARHPGGPLPGPAAMHTTRFYDLTLRQSNHPTGIFCHRACCEHVMFVRDVRRWHSGDPARRSSFPVQLHTRDRAGAPVARRRCGLCEARYAELVTHDDPLAPSNPAIMCRRCFDLLHIGSNGERLAPYVIAQPYNPAIDIVAPGIWAISAGSWGASNVAATAGVD